VKRRGGIAVLVAVAALGCAGRIDTGGGPDGGAGNADGGSDPAYDELDRGRAQARFRTTTDLMRYVFAPGCAAENNECHNDEDFPDLHTEGNLWNLLHLPCNLGIGDRTTVEEFCERQGDQVRITAGANQGFTARIGSIDVNVDDQGQFTRYTVVVDTALPQSQSGAGFEILRDGAVQPALGGGASLAGAAGDYALEVTEEQLARNEAMFRYIVEEADRRGIWVVQMFYNIILSQPFAAHHGLETQLAAPTPVAADYTRKSLAEFVRQYPNVGLHVCLGEALLDIDKQAEWCTQVILPGVKDGMRAAGLVDEPPVIIRAHATDLRVVMPPALNVYRNLFTEAKFNGESLTTWEPRGPGQETHLTLSRLGSTHVANVHILANLEPFRYGAPRFIQNSVQAARDRLGARGLHVYPLAYWNWPNAPDKTDPPLKQYQRDWIWFEAWARYAWNPDIDSVSDRTYWLDRLTDTYGTPRAAALILDAYNDGGECAPRLVRRFGITEGNRQTLSLGMTLDELVNPERYGALPDLWLSQSPPGERLQEYVDRQWNHQPHEGETPPQIVREVLDYSGKAVAAIDAAEAVVTKNRAEFQRLHNDIHCIRAMSQNYAAKVNAALLVLRYQHSRDVTDMEQAARFLAESLEHYRTLAELTDTTYAFANSMQTSHRRIPVPGAIDGQPANFHWSHLLTIYENELAEFEAKVALVKQGKLDVTAKAELKPSSR